MYVRIKEAYILIQAVHIHIYNHTRNPLYEVQPLNTKAPEKNMNN